MTNWPIGLSTGCFYQQSILDCLETIRESGFSLIEVCSSPRHLDYHDQPAIRRVAARIASLGMEAYSFHAPFADQIDISALEQERRQFALQEIFHAVEAAAALQVHHLVIHPGPEHANLPPHEERFRRMENTVETLNRVARRCKELGIRCVLENKLPHLLFGNASDILWILDALEGPDVGACLDTGHAFLSGDLFGLLHKLAGHLRMLHAHDNRGHFDDHLAPGDGVIDWRQVLRELNICGFQGTMMLEIGAASDPQVIMANARRGRSYLRGLGRQLALERL
jgi:sugar phosphate isomerase/epimerase